MSPVDEETQQRPTGKAPLNVPGFALAGAALLALMTFPASAQEKQPEPPGRPVDWTHHHLIFSDPGTEEEAIARRREETRNTIVDSMRYRLQQMARDPRKRHMWDPHDPWKDRPAPSPAPFHKDWSENLGSGIVNPNAYPAKYSFSTTTYSCTTDFVVFPTGTAGSGTTQATILAYNELYGTTTTGCAHTPTPQVYWAYNTAFAYSTNTADGSIVKTSPVLSLDGSQVAFIQVNSSSVASLVLLKWSSSTSTVSLNTAATNVAPSSYRSCTAPCMTRIALNGSPNMTWSAPFYDYEYTSGTADDALYVGDDSGKLHKFTNVFISGTPTEATTGYPVALSGVLAAPTYDPTSGYVFVGNTTGVLYSVVGSSGSIHATSSTLAENTAGIYDAPLVDSVAGKVYVFVAESAGISGAGCATAGYNCVYQFATSFASSTAGLSEPIGVGGSTAAEQYLFSGAFDNIYFASTAGTAGNLYTLGATGTTSLDLYRIPISSGGAMGTPVATALTSPAFPSPLTEFCNNGTSACVSSGTATTSGTDYVFYSVYESACDNACFPAVPVTSGAPAFPAVFDETYGTNFKCFASGGLIVDNAIPTGTEAGASQTYFIGLGGTATNLCGSGSTPASGSILAVQTAQ